MTTRSADATIKGYYYQFDTTILKLLELTSDNDEVIVEGIEDIDINTATTSETVQCKYLSKPKIINSALREPISLMLKHYADSSPKNNLKYTLYAHFTEEKQDSEYDIDLERLKSILTYKEKGVNKCFYTDNGIDDKQLKQFLLSFKLIVGKEFEAQQKEVLKKIQAKFNCSEFEADIHFYNNALRIVVDKAINPLLSERKISKKQFIDLIDKRKILFSKWYIAIKSKRLFLKDFKAQLKESQALLPGKSKTLFISKAVIENSRASLPFAVFVENVLRVHYSVKASNRKAKLITIIIEGNKKDILEFKQGLVRLGIDYNSGYEDIGCFRPSVFNKVPIINLSSNARTIIKSEFKLKILSLDTLITNIEDIDLSGVILNCSENECPYQPSANHQIFDLKYCEDLSDIQTLII